MTDSARLAADTAMGAVTLDVADLDAMTAYYRDAVGLSVLDSAGPVVTLGRSGNASAASVPVVVLRHSPTLKHAGPREAGLFHTAILFETQAALAAAVYTVATAHPQRFTGSSDHLVSQAFYFDDPEGNGVELYWDRDRTQWSWVHGQVEMSTLFLDPNAFLREHLTEEALAAHGTAPSVVGHVHLSVGDTATARDFYVDRLGFDLTTSFGGQAIFVSAGGYHHHMAMNVWRSAGAGRRMPALGLGQVDISLPNADELGATAERLQHHGVAVRDDGRTLELDDPWGTRIRLASA
ncbi:MAG: VOC family protein [Microcella pacifica]|nr:VOC family protein [Actinomycetota bacterium]MBU1608180.1 VOC family protein [Actinomycetota bacterium]MBU2314872.1 VOC family protein [Actinomycetota bacterium]MBU2384853.1 VOC family protein [Actinomycetota bacterium]